ncbi:zf-DHHC-domain-containing protein [Dichomitus squalens]|uniref:Palmitoyltransferase n=1 Tax=Dichomitus squalens TaxID=114155 RepID=A0A4Q9Q052_9APHY|nr:zf-DHHC-domain-containing protein [Dichomitus squalens]TBU59944.1 zf-DHHC-domain-containing protein [Dichomitus squalens]
MAAANGNGEAKDGPGAEHKCIGIFQRANERAEKRRNQPQPWIMRKLAVFITIGIIAYAWYVYIGRFCVPMIRQDASALGSRSIGIAFLVVFCVLGLMMIWAYEKILLTSPGYAKHHVHKSSAPPRTGLPTWWDTESEADLAQAQYGAARNPPQPERKQRRRSESAHKRSISGSTTAQKASQNGHAKAPTGEENVGVIDTLAPVQAVRAKATADSGPPARPEREDTQATQTEQERKPMMYTRSPPKTPVLLPENRYCHKDGFIKPFRAHHCRACGTCVLKYDHHCPWVGQCVGARNHKFFLIFVFWALLFCAFVCSTLIGLVARAAAQNRPDFDVDGQEIAIIALSGFFAIFTTALLVTHVILIADNMSTVEHMGVRRMQEREKRVLGRLHARWQLAARRETRRQWDEEWGRIGKEGHLWWLGSRRRNWEAVMGDRVWMWFLPVGQSPDDGLSYVVNPRFDVEGRWRPRREWPRELQ